MERLSASDYSLAIGSFFDRLVNKYPFIEKLLTKKYNKQDNWAFYVEMDGALGLDETWLATKLLMRAHAGYMRPSQ